MTTSTLAATRIALKAYLKREPRMRGPGRKILKNLAILESPAHGEDSKAAAREQLAKNYERFKQARSSMPSPNQTK